MSVLGVTTRAVDDGGVGLLLCRRRFRYYAATRDSREEFGAIFGKGRRNALNGP
jgi:hypothetical protein